MSYYKGKIDYPHSIQHQSQRKKEKPVDCIYCTEQRECQKKECYYYLGKCFDSTHCKYKVKENEQSFNNKNVPNVYCQKTDKTYAAETCSWQIGDVVLYKQYPLLLTKPSFTGTIIGIENNIITVQFEDMVKKFCWPECKKSIALYKVSR